MRYTKYQYKRKKNKNINFLSSVLMTVLGAGVIGVIVAKLIFGVIGKVDINKPAIPTTTDEVIASTEYKSETFVFVQCGAFSKKEGADAVQSKVQGKANGFVLQDEKGLFRVSAGIYKEDEVDNVINGLKEAGVDVAKVKFNLDGSNIAQGQIAAIIDGYLEIIKTLNNEEVKFVNTEEFKKWVAELPEVEENDDKAKLEELKQHIQNINNEIKLAEINEEYKYLYGILNNYKK